MRRFHLSTVGSGVLAAALAGIGCTSPSSTNPDDTGPGSGSGSGLGSGSMGTCTKAPITSTCAPAHVVLNPAITVQLPSFATALAVGDINGDGKADIVTADTTSSTMGLTVTLSNGDGTFQPPKLVPSFVTGNSLVVADFNGDCFDDILISSVDDATNMGSVELLISKGDGTFEAPGSVDLPFDNTLGLIAADFNKDKRLDFALDGVEDGGIVVSLENAQGQFAPTATFHDNDLSETLEIGGIAAGDLDGDGAADIVAAGSGVCVVENSGTGQFSSAPTCYPASTGYTGDTVAVGDIDGDGHLDVVLGMGESVTNDPGSAIDIFMGNGTGALGDPTVVNYPDAFYGQVSLVDVNNDKKLDLVVYYGTGTGVFDGFTVYLNDGTGKFPATPSGRYAAGGGPQQPAFGDFLGNGLMGMVAVNQVGMAANDRVEVVTASCSP